MLRAMRAYREVGYRFTLCSDHVPQMTDDLDFGLIGRAYNHGYIRAMIQRNRPSAPGGVERGEKVRRELGGLAAGRALGAEGNPASGGRRPPGRRARPSWC